MSESADRYRRLHATPTDRLTGPTVAWLQGYEAGWGDAEERWMTGPTVNDSGPSATLAHLRDELGHVTLDGITLAAHFHLLLSGLAEAIRVAADDSTTWSEAA